MVRRIPKRKEGQCLLSQIVEKREFKGRKKIAAVGKKYPNTTGDVKKKLS